MGGGWLGGGWQGGGWQGGGWQGGGWMSGGGEGMYAMRADRPLVAEDRGPNATPKFPNRYWDSDLFSLTFLPDFFTATVGGKPGIRPSPSLDSKRRHARRRCRGRRRQHR